MYILKKIKRNRETPEGNEEGGNSCVNDRGIVVPTQELGFLSVFCYSVFLSVCVKKSMEKWQQIPERNENEERKRERKARRDTHTHAHKRESSFYTGSYLLIYLVYALLLNLSLF